MAVRPEYFPGLDKVLSNVVWTAGGGLLYMRIEQSWIGEQPGVPPKAQFEFPGIGWSFDGFTVAASKDPALPGAATPAVSNPVTPGMLAALRYWPHRKAVQALNVRQVPGATEKWVVDTAMWTITYQNTDSWLNIFGSKTDAENEGYTILQEVLGAGLINDRSKVGSHLPEYLNYAAVPPRYERIPDPPDPIFFQKAQEFTPSWSYHKEPGTTYTFYGQLDTVTLIVNLSKLLAALPVVQGTNRKPDDYTFRVTEPEFPGPGPNRVNDLQWRIDAAAYSTRVSTPPKSTDGRRDFPVEDQEVNGDIFAYQVPTWSSWTDDALAGGGNINQTNSGNSYVEVKVIFAKGKEPAKVELTSFGAGT